MKRGMLWFDDARDRTLCAKIARATEYYEAKYGNLPTVCYVHPACLADAEKIDLGVKLVTLQDMLPHHFWIGVADVDSAA